MDTKQPNALRLADALGRAPKWQQLQAAAELRRLHAENETLRTGYDAARLEIKSLQARIQELGQMARDCNSRRVMELQAELVKESARTAAEKLRADQMAEQHRMQCEMSKADRAKVQELEAMLAAVGAGGMEPLRKRECLHKIAEPDHFRGATQMVPPDHQALTDTQMHKEFAALRERIFDARIGRACSCCEGGTYQADNNGYSQFHRCNKCHYVPMWGEDGREFGATAAPKGGAHGQPT